MKRLILIGLLALSLSAPVMAEISTSGLSETQKAELQLQAAKMKADEALTKEGITLEKVSEYTILGEQIAKALIGVASELGKEVDEVMGTTVGKIAVALVVYKVMGNDILGFIGGAIWLMIFLPAWIYYFRRFCVIDYIEKEYHENGKLKTKRVIRKNPSDDAIIYFTVILLVGIIVELFLVFV